MNNELLIKLAQDVRTKAYMPLILILKNLGAAVLAESGKVYTGCNVENASYSLTSVLKEAIFKAVSGEINLRKICIVADSSALTPPCGACRQVLAEFNIQEIILANLQGDIAKFRLKS